MTQKLFQEMKEAGFVIERQGKDYVTYKGLLYYCTTIGTLLELHTELIECDWDAGRFVSKATARLRLHSGTEINRTSYGDCTVHNTTKMILPHALRMAGTRAKARALRDITMIGLTAIEEIG